MVNKCSCYGCRGNYKSDGQPYSSLVKFPKDPEEREQWILAMPNDPNTLRPRSTIYICASHFDCEWKKTPGGSRPSQPPSVFPNVPKSCLKQVPMKHRSTSTTSSDAREKKAHLYAKSLDRITDFDHFCSNIQKKFKSFTVYRENNDFYMSKTNKTGQKVILFYHFKHVDSIFGPVFLNNVEKDGMPVSKKLLPLQKNSYISLWSQVKALITSVDQHVFQISDYVQAVLDIMTSMTDCHDSPHLIFLMGQMKLFYKHPKGRTYDTNTLIFAIQLHNLSHSAYQMVRNSGSIILPCVNFIKNMLSKSIQDNNLKDLFEKLKTEQRLVNVMFDEVKLTATLRFSGGHILGYAQNNDQLLATHAMVIEIACHYGGPRYILRVIPCAKLSAVQLKDFLLEAMHTVTSVGGSIISVIGDNCQTNRSMYAKLGGPGKVELTCIGISAFLVYDYVHIFKNIRNNWITVESKKLEFSMDNKEYTACWSDIQNLYENDRITTIRMTKLTHNSVFPKPLQRQSVPLVCQVFNDKTVAALTALQTSLCINDGTIVFVRIVSDWFKMMNVKDRFSGIASRDDCRSPWTLNCDTFQRLDKTCEIISSCAWKGGKDRKLKLTKQTAEAFTVSTLVNVEAAKYLLTNKKFNFVLPAIFADEAIEKFFGQARQRSGGSFYIDSLDILAAAKIKNLQTLTKYEIMPDKIESTSCVCTPISITENSEVFDELSLCDTEELLQSNEALKHKIVYISGYIVRKFGDNTYMEVDEGDQDLLSTEFLDNLNKGGLSLPTLSTVYFVHTAYHLHQNLKLRCNKHFAELLSKINAPIADNMSACIALANILLKAFVINNSDKEKTLGCLRRKEKLSD